ncbi:MAG: carboxypeptidase-like regulatory domain-containing protein [Candidatus Marinimicrobia bacterium]|nr:carboxypeptidase-like regulatory domain-containing protein [Candidatus Neomarinimicrobiota bacterium]
MNKIRQISFTIYLVILFSGCSSFKGPLYPDIIYNNRQPLISVTYEYGEIQLILPLRYDAAVPDNILFKVFAQGDTVRPIISILQEAPKEFLAYLPQGVLDIQNSTNLIKIIPQDKNFDPITVRFKGISFGRIVLPPKTLRIGQLVVSGNTYLNKNDSTISNVDVSIQNFDNVIYTTRSNASGFYQLAIPGEYRFAEHLRVVAGENLIFKPFTKKLDFSNNRKLKLEIGLGPSKGMVEPLYMTNKDNVHFREGPDIGSETLFLLKAGEVISVDRVTPGEYFGFIEVLLDENRIVKMEGWINRSDLRLVNMQNVYKLTENN